MQSIRTGWRGFVALTERRRKTAITLTLLLATIPAWRALSWVLQYGVDVPIKDDWDMAPLIVKAQTGQLSFADLFQQQHEARMVLPALIFILSAAGSHWDVRALMLLSVAICVLTAAGIYSLLLQSGLRLWTAALCFWVATAVIFSAAQFELWVWASGFPSFLPALFLVLALATIETQLSSGSKFAVCATCATGASFTLSHGLLLWGLTFPVLLLGGREQNWRRWLCGWIAATAVCTGVYFHGYVKPAAVPDFAPAVAGLDYLRYFLAFLGGEFTFSLRANRATLATAAGAVLLAIYLAMLGFALLRRRDLGCARRMLPWFTLGGYSLGCAGLATLGRVGFGIDSALSSRYVTFSLYLTVAVVVLVALAGSELCTSKVSLNVTTAFCGICVILAGAAAILHQLANNRCVRLMQTSWAETRLFRAAVLFSHAIDTSAALRRAGNPSPDVVRARAAALDELKLLRPRLVRTAEIGALQTAESETVAGNFEIIERIDDQQARASGFAVLKRQGRPADAVLLAYETPAQSSIAFAISDAVVRRRDVARAMRDQRHVLAGWTVTFPRVAVPAGARISAWALDADVPKVYRLEQNVDELKL